MSLPKIKWATALPEEDIKVAASYNETDTFKIFGDGLRLQLENSASQITAHVHKGAIPTRHLLQMIVLDEDDSRTQNRSESLLAINQIPEPVLEMVKSQLDVAIDMAIDSLNLDSAKVSRLLLAFETVRCSVDTKEESDEQAKKFDVDSKAFLTAYNDFYSVYEGANNREAKSHNFNLTEIPLHLSERANHIKGVLEGNTDPECLKEYPVAILNTDEKLTNLFGSFENKNPDTPAEIVAISVDAESMEESIAELCALSTSHESILLLSGTRREILTFILLSNDIKIKAEALGIVKDGHIDLKFDSKASVDSSTKIVSPSPLQDPNISKAYTLDQAKLGFLLSHLIHSKLKSSEYESDTQNNSSQYPQEKSHNDLGKKTSKKQKSGICLPSEYRKLIEDILPYLGMDLFFGGAKIDQPLFSIFDSKDEQSKGVVALRYSKIPQSEYTKCHRLSSFFDRLIDKASKYGLNPFIVVPFSAGDRWQTNARKILKAQQVTAKSDCTLGVVLNRPDVKKNDWIDLSASVSLRTIVSALNEYITLNFGLIKSITSIAEDLSHEPEEKRNIILKILKNSLGVKISAHLDSVYDFRSISTSEFKNICDSAGVRIRRIASQLLDVPFNKAISIARQIVEDTPNLLTVSSSDFISCLPSLATEYIKPERDEDEFFEPVARKVAGKTNSTAVPVDEAEEKNLSTLVSINEIYTDLLIEFGIDSESAEAIAKHFVVSQINLKPILRKLHNSTNADTELRERIISDKDLWLNSSIFQISERINTIKYLLSELVHENSITCKEGILDHIATLSPEIFFGDNAVYKEYLGSLTSLFETIRLFSLNPSVVLGGSEYSWINTESVNVLNNSIRASAFDNSDRTENLNIATLRYSIIDLKTLRGNIDWEKPFFDKDTESFCLGINVNRLPPFIRDGVEEILSQLHTAPDFSTLKKGRYRLHTLSNSAVRWAMSTPEMAGYRVCFNWKSGKISSIWIGDYHKKEDQKIIVS